MKAKFDVKKVVDAVADKQKFIALLVTIAYNIFGASKIKNSYLRNASVIVVPAVLGSFFMKDKQAVNNLVMAGLAIGGVQFIKDIIAHMAASETDPKKKAQYTTYLTALNGSSDTVSGFSMPPASVAGRQVNVQYQAPRKPYNEAARINQVGAF